MMTKDPFHSRPSQSHRWLLQRLLKNLADTGRTRKQLISIAFDGLVALLALWLALSARLNTPFTSFGDMWHLFALIPFITIGAFGSLGIYRWIIRSSNHLMLQRIALGAAGSAFGLLAIQYLLPPNELSNPRSLFAIYFTFLILGTAGLRLTWQGLFGTGTSGEPVAIYGAGDAGRQLAAMLSQRNDSYAVLFIDDDPALRGQTIGGVPVVVTEDEGALARRVRRSEARRLILAIPSVRREVYRERLARAERLGLPVQTLPSMNELVACKLRPDDIRDVSINDILGRAEVPPDRNLIGACVTGRTVLVTGGGGSIGSELCRQIFLLSPRRLIILDQSEENLYKICESLDAHATANECPAPPLLPLLGSVSDEFTVNELFASESIDTVYHAAACKHVPIVELQPERGVETNVFGTLRVVEAAMSHGVSDVVLVSSDKAVRPANAMGATKRIAELILQAKSHGEPLTRLSMVRFGNVLGSSGSVVPKFRKQIESGGPVTLTDRRMTRYFMTIPEAAQLVLQASAIATGGDVFVLDMGDPIRIEDLARTMIERSGRRVATGPGDTGPDTIEIVESGLRPGEKLYEELFVNSERHTRTGVAKIFTSDEPCLGWSSLSAELRLLRTMRGRAHSERLRAALLALAESVNESGDERGTVAVSPISARTGEVAVGMEDVVCEAV